MMKLRIGVDIDGVLYQWEKTARYMLREILPNSPYKEDGPLGQVQQHWGYIEEHVTPEHMKWLWTEGVRLGLFRHGHLHSGSIKAVRRLAEIGEVILITHRPKQAVNDTLAWIAFQNLPISGLNLLTDMEPKSSVKPECDVYIDDKIDNVVDLWANTKAKLIAFPDREWNRDRVPILHANPVCKRVFSWDEFIQLVTEVANG